MKIIGEYYFPRTRVKWQPPCPLFETQVILIGAIIKGLQANDFFWGSIIRDYILSYPTILTFSVITLTRLGVFLHPYLRLFRSLDVLTGHGYYEFLRLETKTLCKKPIYCVKILVNYLPLDPKMLLGSKYSSISSLTLDNNENSIVRGLKYKSKGFFSVCPCLHYVFQTQLWQNLCIDPKGPPAQYFLSILGHIL